jgi:Arf-GAP domain and FG repeat-containing protein 1
MLFYRGKNLTNITIDSFFFYRRGLNPPHRVKSISMASFTPDEMEFLKCHGNEVCL